MILPHFDFLDVNTKLEVQSLTNGVNMTSSLKKITDDYYEMDISLNTFPYKIVLNHKNILGVGTYLITNKKLKVKLNIRNDLHS